jgi:hypothetical protein
VTELTREDLRELRETLTGEMRTGFAAVNQRLDRLNGRVGQLERESARQDTEIRHLRHHEGAWPASPRAFALLIGAIVVLVQILDRVVGWAMTLAR